MEQVRNELDQGRDRQAHDVGVVALDPLHQSALRGPGSRSHRPARATRPTARYQSRSASSSSRKVTCVTRAAVRSAPVRRRSARPLQTSWVRPESSCRNSPAPAASSPGLPYDAAVESDDRVDAQDELALHRPRLPQRVLDHQRRAGPLRPARRPRGPDGERDAELLQDRPPLRRARGQDQLCGHASAQLGEEERGLAGGRLGRVRAVHHVLADQQGEVAADRARWRTRAGRSRRSPGARP